MAARSTRDNANAAIREILSDLTGFCVEMSDGKVAMQYSDTVIAAIAHDAANRRSVTGRGAV